MTTHKHTLSLCGALLLGFGVKHGGIMMMVLIIPYWRSKIVITINYKSLSWQDNLQCARAGSVTFSV